MQSTGILAASWLFLIVFASPALAQKADPAVYGGLPTVSEAALSPDGSAIAQIQSVDGVRSIAFYDLTGERHPVGMELGNVKARDLFWINEKYVLLLVSSSFSYERGEGNRIAEIWRWLAIDRSAKTKTYLFRSYYDGLYYFGSGIIKSSLPDDPDSVLLGQWHSGFSLFKVGLDKEREELMHKGEVERSFREIKRRTVDWIVNSHGDPVVRVDYNRRDEMREFYVPSPTYPGWRLANSISEGKEEDTKVTLLTPADHGTIIYAYSKHEGVEAIYEFDVETGEYVQPIVRLRGLDLHSVVNDHIAGKVVGARYIDHMMHTIFIDPVLKGVQEAIEKALPNAAPVIESWSTDKTKFLVRVKYSDHPDQIFLFDKEKRSLSMIAATYEPLDGKVYAEKEPFKYTASDGLEIRGYLTVPTNRQKTNLPLIVLPHGGPWARDDQSFDWWSFFYAARGYLVYQPNFRGSTGYGTAFKEASFGEWGRKMQDDITEGVQKLVADGVVDPNRICIVGGSYGGYAALAGATLTPDLYSCAVSVNGVSNIMQLLADAAERSGGGDDDFWAPRVGSRFSNEDELRAVSPLYNASSVQAPVLLIHSEKDIVVPVGQSRRMRNALRDLGKEHEFIILDGEDHWLSLGETRTEMLRASIDFIDRHIGQ